MFNFFRRKFLSREGGNGAPSRVEPTVIPRDQHRISRSNISENALKVLYRLHKNGFQSFLVGGAVRDLLLGREPKDFDIATDAQPEQVRKLFRNSRLIGRRFRLAHVQFGREIIEVATFRGPGATVQAGEDENGDHVSDQGILLSDNVFGTLEQDAWRRDFSANAMYYSISDFSVWDFTGGMADLEAGVLRMIGDPEQRYREDPVRMLRAVRFAAKLGFRIHPGSAEPLQTLAPLIREVSSSRLFDETIKMFLSGTGLQTFELMRKHGLFAQLFPHTEAALAVEEQNFPLTLVAKALANTDQRIADGKPVTPAFLYAALLWEPVRQLADRLLSEQDDLSWLQALQSAGGQMVGMQAPHTSVPKRFSVPMREIWNLQSRLRHRVGKRPMRLLGHPRFRAGYDFLLLRAESGEEEPELVEWWTEFQECNEEARFKMTKPPRSGRGRRRRGGTDEARA